MGIIWFRGDFLRCFPRCHSVLLPYFFLMLSTVSAQSNLAEKEEENYYGWFDQQVQKEHLPLYNGIGYVEKYKVINTYHKFFKSTDFLQGSMFYDGQMYPNLEMKYDLHDDLVLLNLRSGQRMVLLQPDQEKIDDFKIDGRHFVHIQDSISKVRQTAGYYELLYQGVHFQLLEKHVKKRFERKGKNALYSEFKSRNKNYFYFNGEHYILNNRKDFEKAFPSYKKQIQGYSKKRFPKENRNLHLIALARRVDDLITKSKTEDP